MATARPAHPTAAAAAVPTATARRRATMVLVALLAACALTLLPGLGAPAKAAGVLSPAEQDYVNRANALRAGLGLAPLQVDVNLSQLAQQHTQEMAATQDLHHTADLVAGVTSTWEKLGENVGVGSNSDVVWNAFLNSPHHYENLTNPAFTHIGVGVVVDASGLQWTTHRFMTVAPPPPPPFVPPAPVVVAPAPAPVPAPKVVVTPQPRVVTPPVAVTPTTTAAAPTADTPPAPTPPPAPVVVSPADPRSVDATLSALHAI